MALSLICGPAPTVAQGLELSPAASLGLVVLDARVGASAAAGPRLTWGPFAFQGALDVSIVGWGGSQGRYKWSWFTCKDTTTRETVSAAYCPDPEVRVGGVLDGALVIATESNVWPSIGAGYRVGDAATWFGTVGLIKASGFPNRWYARLLVGNRFLQLHFGITLG